MKIKNENKIRVLLGIFLLVVICSIIFFIFKTEMSNEKLEKTNVGIVAENTILPIPDRIIYKNANNEYIIIYTGTSAYTKIYSELYNRTTNIIEGKVYSEDDISQMQNKGSFIEVHYQTEKVCIFTLML